MAIYLKLEKQPQSLHDVLDGLYYMYSEAATHLSALPTYHDPECNDLQCQGGRFRSYDDLFEIFSTYFPGVTTKEVTHALLSYTRVFKRKTLRDNKLVTVEEIANPQLAYCGSMRRIRFLYHFNSIYFKDEYLDMKLDSRWSWRHLLGELGIHNEEELMEYVEEQQAKAELTV